MLRQEVARAATRRLSSMNRQGELQLYEDCIFWANRFEYHLLCYRYLFLLRMITVIDAVGLVYRAIVPAPIWLAYYFSGTYSAANDLRFSSDGWSDDDTFTFTVGVGGKFFSPCYFIFKVFQISNRIRDTLDVLKIFFQGSLVRPLQGAAAMLCLSTLLVHSA